MSKTAGHKKPSATTLPSFKRILLVTDFSACSAAAVPFAGLLAEYYHSTVVVVHVLSESPNPNPEQAAAELRQTHESAQAEMAKLLAENTLGEFPTETVITQGPVWEAIAEVIRDKQIDLVVLGTAGRSGVRKLVLGSVAQRIFSLAPCPVLSVAPKAHKSWSAEGKLTRIVYATDFSAQSKKALPHALSLAKVSNAELLLVHAPEPPATGSVSPQIMQSYHDHLNALIPAQEKSWCRSDTLVIAGDPAKVILNVAAKHNADFIVMGAHAIEGTLSTFQVPLSTAYRVVAHAPCPVLRVRSQRSLSR